MADHVCYSKAFGSDDVMVIVLLVVFTVYLAAQIQGWRHGLGQHESQLSPENRSAALMWWWICFLLYIVCVCLFKIAVGLFLMRVAVVTLHIWILRIIMFGVCTCGTGYFFMAIFQCHPPSTWWTDSPRAPDKCWEDRIVLGMDLAASIINCGGDWVLGVLPIFMVKSLNMRRRTKILVACLLSFAAVGSTATFVRIFFLPKLLDGEDFLYSSAEVAYLSTVESGIGITAVSIGTLKPLVEQLQSRMGTSSARTESHVASWSRRNRSNGQRRSYIRANGNDQPATPRSGLGSIFHLSTKSSGPSMSNTMSNQTVPEIRVDSDEEQAVHPTSNMELSQLSANSIHVRNSVLLEVSPPAPAAVSHRVFATTIRAAAFIIVDFQLEQEEIHVFHQPI
ncbi:hypothetical protein PFICI_12784 [Pestalotiopsis fici W106-1]|uniref:Rhodopsin domain-containing protein n=1 Tax=Pestalotiopsis fici (strain W106-1 / CGMCC3.15140) TaxID=1229662 RepID=W3WPL2_PESFW|nr:uncharacterized protein PFICI_12784 [Pestalotiopsis fici W106-1]ETS75840.1 hypothetical protein PFICI_12784 [Pestalotiopsis fici W106-1]